VIVPELLRRCFRLALFGYVNGVSDIFPALGGTALSALYYGVVERFLDRDALLWIGMHHLYDELFDRRRPDHAHEAATLRIADFLIRNCVGVLSEPVSPAFHEFLKVFVVILDRLEPEVAGEAEADPENSTGPDVQLGGVIGDYYC
jgi:hypothetical protein